MFATSPLIKRPEQLKNTQVTASESLSSQGGHPGCDGAVAPAAGVILGQP